MSFKDSFRALRRNFKARLPYVRRREHTNLQRKYDELIDGLGWTAPSATQARLFTFKAMAQPLDDEVCFFVSYAPTARLKAHVRWHIEHLLRVGVKVVLILNTEVNPADFALDPELTLRLSGVYIRDNVGFDFAAWAHLYALCDEKQAWTRLYLINDSIVGPLNTADFDRIVERIRSASADVIGLTESQSPVPHVQSFFLVLNASALRSAVMQRVFKRMLSLPTKGQVIDVYETRMTRVLTRGGLRCEALFPPLSNDPHSSNDTSFRWERLIQSGFPYIKTSILAAVAGGARAKALVPAEFLTPET